MISLSQEMIPLSQLMAFIGLLIWLLASCIYGKALSQEIKRYVEAEKQGISRPHVSNLQLTVRSCLGLSGFASIWVLIETIRQGEPNFAPYFCAAVMLYLSFWALFAALNKASEEKEIRKKGQEG